VFALNCPNGPPVLRENYGFAQKSLIRIEAALAASLAVACGEWESIHGHS